MAVSNEEIASSIKRRGKNRELDKRDENQAKSKACASSSLTHEMGKEKDRRHLLNEGDIQSGQSHKSWKCR